MWSEDYLEIQMLMARYRVSIGARTFMTIPNELFSKADDVRLSPEEGEEISGFEGICAYFRTLMDGTERNGGVTGADFPVSQVIHIADSGETAQGAWLTFSVRVLGPAFTEASPPYAMPFSVGRYCCEFIHNHGRWRIMSMEWRPVFSAAPWEFRFENSHGLATDHPELWPQPLPRINASAGMLSAEKTAEDLQCENVLRISNLVGLFAHRQAMGEWSAAAEHFFAPDAVYTTYEREKAVSGLPEILKVFRENERRAVQDGGYFGADLTTSPVIYVNRRSTEGRGMWTTFSLRKRGGQLHPTMGRWYAEFANSPAGWRCVRFRAVDIADLEPWRFGKWAGAVWSLPDAEV